MNFSSVLVANRGEIALRVMKTCRDMGLKTVAVYSDADIHAPHVAFADRAVRIGPAAAHESYLLGETIIAAAQKTGAGAIHPGYGFLAENADFAEAVTAAGLVFIGPTADAIRAMGDKARARALMTERGVPVAPGYSGDDQSDETLIQEGHTIGIPLLVKAAAGGGGKGMSIVRDLDDLPDAIAGARRVARSAFGDDTLLLETYVDSPRHIEVQILGDQMGRVVHCFERECSVQRRFQKVIEEAPSMAVDDALRARLCAAAVTAGEALGYQGAGTVEFILSPRGEFYFLEVNTRLQVEHPVTECVTGLDLVEWQLRIAQGEPVFEQASVHCTGHAVEARLYAEDPANEYLPSTGQLVAWTVPESPHLRVDSGVRRGTVVGIDYDPMLAKLIAVGPDRTVATQRLIHGLQSAHIAGMTTNREFLCDVLAHPRFLSGDLSTHFLAETFSDWVPQHSEDLHSRAVIAGAIWNALDRASSRQHLPQLRPGWRSHYGQPNLDEWVIDDRVFTLGYRPISASSYAVELDGARWQVTDAQRSEFGLEAVIQRDDDSVGILDRFSIYPQESGFHIFVDGIQVYVTETPRFPEADVEDTPGGCVAPMPGRVVQLNVEVGDRVEVGQTLVVLEAMKMEQSLNAPVSGVVDAVNCSEGDVVEAGVVLVRVEDETTSD